MSVDMQGLGLGLMTKLAGSELTEKFNLRKPLQRLAYTSVRNGFELVENFQQRRLSKKLSSNSSSPLFDLSLTDEQSMIKETIESYARDNLRPIATKANENKALPPTYFEDLSVLGLNYFSVPETMGGAAQHYSPTTSSIIAEGLAWGDLTLAYAALAPLAVANTIVKWGTEHQKSWILPKFLRDNPVVAAIAVQENNPLFDANKLATTAKKIKGGYQLQGEKILVPFNGTAELYLVSAQYNNQPAVFIIDGQDPSLSWQPSAAMGLRGASMGTLILDKITVPADAKLGNEDFSYSSFINSSHLHWCSLAIGTCQAALDYIVPYVNERSAFGEPVSHRQSVAFLVANIAIELESMRLMTWRAAALFEAGESFHQSAYLAHLLCSQKAMEIGTNTVQLLGGHGFTKEHPAERWYRDLRGIACISGGLHL